MYFFILNVNDIEMLIIIFVLFMFTSRHHYSTSLQRLVVDDEEHKLPIFVYKDSNLKGQLCSL